MTLRLKLHKELSSFLTDSLRLRLSWRMLESCQGLSIPIKCFCQLNEVFHLVVSLNCKNYSLSLSIYSLSMSLVPMKSKVGTMSFDAFCFVL